MGNYGGIPSGLSGLPIPLETLFFRQVGGAGADEGVELGLKSF
jgi:hypothetical protein